MEQTTDAVTTATEQAPPQAGAFDAVIQLADYIFSQLDAWGYAASAVVGLVLWAIFSRKSFVKFWAWVFRGIREQITASATKMYYEEQLKKLEEELADERKRCDEQIKEMRRDYEAKIAALESKIDILIEANTKNAATIAQLNERVDNLTARLQKKIGSVGTDKTA